VIPRVVAAALEPFPVTAAARPVRGCGASGSSGDVDAGATASVSGCIAVRITKGACVIVGIAVGASLIANALLFVPVRGHEKVPSDGR
jgi:hypothetical protein